jgi:alkylhydroperoxidase family enzyme
VLLAKEADLDPAEEAMVTWARKVVRDPNATTADDVQALRDAGFTDSQIFAITTFVALRMAFSTVNDALGARPDRELVQLAPTRIVSSVTYGRTPG